MRSRSRPDARAARKQEPFEAIYRRHYPELLRFATARVDPDSARDLVAEVLLVAWRRFDDVPDPARPWLYGVARGVLANHIRSGHRRDVLQQRLAYELQ